MFNHDRKFIENKYHKTDEPFNPYARMAYHGYGYDKSTGLEDEEIRDGLAKLYEKNKGFASPGCKSLCGQICSWKYKNRYWGKSEGLFYFVIMLQ